MKQWTSATAPGICAYDVAHTWKQDDRIVVVSGATWSKKYCGACGMRLFNVPPDTGELRTIHDEPQYPKALLEFTGVTRPMDFDAKEQALPPGDRADAPDPEPVGERSRALREEVGF
jgi:hypothetical protein